MAITLERWDESNDSGGESVTTGVSNSNFGSTDGPNLVVASNAITPNSYSYSKLHKITFQTNVAGEQLNNWKYSFTVGSLSGSDTVQYEPLASYAAPINTTISGTTATATPTAFSPAMSALDLTLASTNYTMAEYIHHQLFVHSATTSGASGLTVTITYDRVTP